MESPQKRLSNQVQPDEERLSETMQYLMTGIASIYVEGTTTCRFYRQHQISIV